MSYHSPYPTVHDHPTKPSYEELTVKQISDQLFEIGKEFAYGEKNTDPGFNFDVISADILQRYGRLTDALVGLINSGRYPQHLYISLEQDPESGDMIKVDSIEEAVRYAKKTYRDVPPQTVTIHTTVSVPDKYEKRKLLAGDEIYSFTINYEDMVNGARCEKEAN